MRKIILNNSVVEDNYTLITDKVPDQALSGDGPWLVPLCLWQSQRSTLNSHSVGVWLDSDEPPEALANDLTQLPLIAINFPVFTDGRGYSYARLLRRMGYKGELRAIGDVLRDQLFLMKRCGFDSFSPRDTDKIEDYLVNLQDFTDPYQGAEDNHQPLFRRQQRG